MNPLPAGPFGVIYADPSWRFEPWSRITGMGRAAEKRYPTITLEPIKALRIPAADDSALFHIMACELGPNVWSALVYRLDNVVEAAFLRPAELIAYWMSGSKGPRSRHWRASMPVARLLSLRGATMGALIIACYPCRKSDASVLMRFIILEPGKAAAFSMIA